MYINKYQNMKTLEGLIGNTPLVKVSARIYAKLET